MVLHALLYNPLTKKQQTNFFKSFKKIALSSYAEYLDRLSSYLFLSSSITFLLGPTMPCNNINNLYASFTLLKNLPYLTAVNFSFSFQFKKCNFIT